MNNNVDFIGEALLPLLFTLIIIIILYFSVGLISNYDNAAIAITVLSLLFFSYGHIINYIRRFQLEKYGEQVYHVHRYILLLYFIIILMVIYLIFKSPLVSSRLTKSLNIASLAIFIIPISNSTLRILYKLNQNNMYEHNIITYDKNNKEKTSNMPDIYYIITDGHTSSKNLDNYFKYNNSDYTNKMKTIGFYESKYSNANYAVTGDSIESSLNINYIKTATSDADQVENNFVVKYLTNKQYKYYHFLSGWKGGTNRNAFADQVINCGNISEFQMMIVNSSALLILDLIFNVMRSEARDKVMCQFRELAKVSQYEGPKFVFAHILSPHPPYVFGKNGGVLKNLNITLTSWRPQWAYLEQLEFIQKKLITTVNLIIKNSKIAPIIVLQGDHGPSTTHKSGNLIYDNYTTVDNIKERLGIMNMYYLPEKCKSSLTESITPVNSFRVILNCIFNENFDLLENRHKFLGHDVTSIIYN